MTNCFSVLARACAVFLLLAGSQARAQKFYTFIDDLGTDFVELGWGTADGANTIGRTAPSKGEATIKIAGRTLTSRSNFITVNGLEPDHEYTYQVALGNKTIADGKVRTWAANATKLAFFVIGDYGTGAPVQYQVAEAMWKEFQNRMNGDNPVRFVLSTGDNIYGNLSGFLFGAGSTGSQDKDWAPKFYQPYEQIIARVPWFATLGNHDGNETESQADLPAYLDNFPFPGDKAARYYHFNYGGLVDFFGLDSTRNTESGSAAPNYLENGKQFQWLKQELGTAKAPWKIPYFHHPPFNAGPLHAPSLRELHHFVEAFSSAGVKVVFNGHEHNFQMSEVNDASYGIRFVTSGAGGELRPGNIQKKMRKANIAAWAPQNHFLVVEIEGKTMKITPLSFQPVNIKDSDGKQITPPILVTLP